MSTKLVTYHDERYEEGEMDILTEARGKEGRLLQAPPVDEV